MIERYEDHVIKDYWSDYAKYNVWFIIELEHMKNIVPKKLLKEIDKLGNVLNNQQILHIKELEVQTKHDVAAFVKWMSNLVGYQLNEYIHHNLTSSDIVDTANAFAINRSYAHYEKLLQQLRNSILDLAKQYPNVHMLARTHGQAAQLTSFAIRLYTYINDIDDIHKSKTMLGKMSGAVGVNSAETYIKIYNEPVCMSDNTTQVVNRINYAQMMNNLALMACQLEKMALDIRLLVSEEVGELILGKSEGQVGSSAMPHKRNPAEAEKVCGMARLMRGYAATAMENVALWNERDISHSSVERVIIPDAFHIICNMITTLENIFESMKPNLGRIEENINRVSEKIVSEYAMNEKIKEGQDRITAHREVSEGVDKNKINKWLNEMKRNVSACEDRKAKQHEH